MTAGRISGSSLTRVGASQRPAQHAREDGGARANSSAPAASAGRPRTTRNVLHGWRLLAGPLVVQVLQSGYDVPTHWPSALVLSRYRRPCKDETPVVREIA